MVLPAIAMAVSLGVTLPTPARAQTTIPVSSPSTTTVNLASYGGATSFDLPSANSINTGLSNGIYGDSGSNWTLTNEGQVTGGQTGVWLASTSTVTNSGTLIGSNGPALFLNQAGLVENLAAGTIIGGTFGVEVGGSGGTVLNHGTIIANSGYSSGVYFNRFTTARWSTMPAA